MQIVLFPDNSKSYNLCQDNCFAAETANGQASHFICLLQNAHINELMKRHERAFAEIKNYYNDITHNNLDLIKALKEDVAEMKKREAQNEKLM